MLKISLLAVPSAETVCIKYGFVKRKMRLKSQFVGWERIVDAIDGSAR
jgi:hypothetical protein